MDTAIICSAIPARKKLLERSISTWQQSIDSSNLKVKIYLHLEDKENWTDFDPYRYSEHLSLGGVNKSDLSGSHITGYNYWIDRIDADVYLFTHPDLLFPIDTIKTAYDLAIPNRFVAFKVLWIPEEMTNNLDNYNWRNPELLEQEKDLYPSIDFADGRGEFYWNSDVRSKTEYHSTTTFSIDSELAHKIYPMPNLFHQGYDDPLHYQVRRLLGVEDYCVSDPILFHAHHPQTWDQNMEQAMQESVKLLNEHYYPLFKEKKWI